MPKRSLTELRYRITEINRYLNRIPCPCKLTVEYHGRSRCELWSIDGSKRFLADGPVQSRLESGSVEDCYLMAEKMYGQWSVKYDPEFQAHPSVSQGGAEPARQRLKLLIIGHARHGKDTAAEILRDNFSIKFCSSSLFIAERAVMPVLGHLYSSVEECYLDRGNHRKEWKDAIKAYNTPDLTRLSREMLETLDLYVGMRDKEEFEACREAGLFDLVIWVDASERHPPEPKDSNQLSAAEADIIITNNGTLQELNEKVKRLGLALFGQLK